MSKYLDGKVAQNEAYKDDICVLLCGTFNPITNAHMNLAKVAKEYYPKADIIFVPSNIDFMKDWKEVNIDILVEHRLEILENAINDADYLLSSIENDGTVDGRTINTVKYFKERYKEVVLCFGSDKLPEFKNWYKFDELKDIVSFLIVTRGDEPFAIDKYCKSLNIKDYNIIVSEDCQDISSTKVREAFYTNQLETILYDVPTKVFLVLNCLLIEHKGATNNNFDPMQERENLVQKIRDWFDKNGSNCKAVIGISGGKDSTVAAALCCEALGKERVLGVLMPNNKQSDIDDSYKVCEALDIEYLVINIGDTVKAVLRSIDEAYGRSQDYTNLVMTNLPPRIRMSTLYAISQKKNGRVINTSNASERYVGWGTLYGDTVGDVSLFGNLTATEVVAIGNTYDELPKHLINKAPSDGLTGKTDEDNLGFTYEVLDKYIRSGICGDEEIKQLIDKKHEASEFKRKGMTIL